MLSLNRRQPRERWKLVSWVVAFCLPLVLFLALAYKQPYSGRSLIGNFDPFPDTFYYVIPPLKLVTTGRFETSTQYGKVRQAVPPLYGLTLIPGYAVNQDPRTYYFTNLFLGLASVTLLFFILKKATGDSLVLTSFGTLLYVTQYGIYWQPQLAMAENLLVSLLLLTIWVWQKPSSGKNFVFITLFGWSLVATKYVAFPLTVGWLLLVAVRSWRTATRATFWRQMALLMTISAAAVLLVVGVSPFMSAGQQVTAQLAGSLPSNVASTVRHATPTPSFIWLSSTHFATSFPTYGSILLGQPTLHLWSDHRLVPPLFTVVALVWAVAAVIRHWKNERLAWAIVVLTTLQFTFLSLIEMVQSRYAYVFIPLVIIGVTLALTQFHSKVSARYSPQTAMTVTAMVAALLLLFHLGLSATELKTQLQVNRHRSEVAWWREGLVQTDQLLASRPTDKQRIMITALPPFLWELYANPTLMPLPLNEQNYFTSEPIWGMRPPAGQSWLSFYQTLVNQPNVELYISTSGFTGGDYERFVPYRELFKLELMMTRCNDTCKVYRLRQT